MMRDDVTVLIYTFLKPGANDVAFAKIAMSIERTREPAGRLKPVIAFDIESHYAETLAQACDNWKP